MRRYHAILRSSPFADLTTMRRHYHDQDAGLAFTRQVICKALQHLSMREITLGPGRSHFGLSQGDIAHRRWGIKDAELVAVIKANEVAGGGTGSGEPLSELVQHNARYQADFVEFLYGQSVFDRLPLRGVPRNVTIHGQSSAATAFWAGESKAGPLTSFGFADGTDTSARKVLAIVVVSNDWLRDSSPEAERWVRDALAKAIVKRVDTTFTSAAAAVTDVSPAGVLNGIAPIASTGAIAADLRALLAPFVTAKNLSSLFFVTTPALAAAIAMSANSAGGPAFPDVGIRGGEIGGIPVVAGDNVPDGALLLLSAEDIWRVDLGLSVSISTNAMIEQSSAPTGATDTPTAASATPISTFQEESTAIKLVRHINFGKLRSDVVAWVDDADYPAAS